MKKHTPPSTFSRWIRCIFSCGALFAVTLFTGGNAQAANGPDTWTGVTNTWNTLGNWTTGSANKPPISGDSLIFGAAGVGGLDLNNNLTSSSFNIAGITFNSGAGAFVIGNGTATANTGNAFNLTGAVTNNSTALEMINDPFSMTAVQTFTMTTGGGNITLGGNISGTGGGITTAGAGTMTLTGANTFTGGLTINAGTLEGTTSANALGGSSGTGRVALGSATGTTAATLLGDGRTFANPITVVSGDTGMLTIGNISGDGTTFSGTITENGPLTLQETGAASTASALIIKGAITGSSTITVISDPSGVTTGTSGQGEVTLGVASPNFTGMYLIQTGALAVRGFTNSNNIVEVASGALLDVTGANDTIAGLNNVSGSGGYVGLNPTVGSSRQLILNGSGVYSFAGTIENNNTSANLSLNVNLTGNGSQTLSGNNTYGGGTFVTRGTLNAGSATALGATTGSLTVSSSNASGGSGPVVLNLFTTPITTVGSLSGTAGTGANTDTINIAGNDNLTVNQTVSGSYAGVIAGSGSSFTLGSLSSATLTLAGNNTYSGGTTLNAGTVAVTGTLGTTTNGLTLNGTSTLSLEGTTQTLGAFNGASGATITNGLVVSNASTLIVGNGVASGTSTYAGSILDGNGLGTTLEKIGGGIQILSGANSMYSGGTIINGGILEISSENNIGNASVYLSAGNGVDLRFGGITLGGGELLTSATISIIESVTLNAGGTNTLAALSSTTAAYSGAVVNGTGSALTVGDSANSGTGTVNLTGSNTYTGNTTITIGTLAIGGAGQLGSGSYAGSIANSGTFNYNSSVAQTLSGVISGTGALTESGPGTLALTGSSANTDTGLTTVSGGELDLDKTAGVNSIAGNATVSGGILKLLTSNQIDAAATLRVSSGTLDFNGQSQTVTSVVNTGGTVTYGGAGGAGTVTVTDPTWQANGTNIVSGLATITNGLIVTGGTNTITGGSTDGQGILTLQSSTALAFTGAGAPAITINGDASAPGIVRLQGNVTVDGASTATIGTTAGTDNGELDLAGGNRTFTVGGTSNPGLEVDAQIVDSANSTGALTKAGTGIMIVTGNNTYGGGTTISNGLLYVNNGGVASYAPPVSQPRTIKANNVTGSASGTGTGNVTVQSGGTLAGSGTITPTGGAVVTVQSNGTLASGAVQTNVIGQTGQLSNTGYNVTSTGLTIDNAEAASSILAVSGGATLTFDLGAGTNTGSYAYSNPNTNSTYISIAGNTAGEITFGTSANINVDLVDLTAFEPVGGGTLTLRFHNPYLLIQAGQDSDYNLYTTGGYDQNGFITGIGTLDQGDFSISVYDINGMQINGPTNLGGLNLYLYNGDLEVVPEPGTWALMIGGLALLVFIQRRKNKL